MAREPTADERALIAKLRRRSEELGLSEDEDGDTFILRWLRASDPDVDQAEVMLKQLIKWRHENDIDNVLNWQAPPFFHIQYPTAISGYDEDNCPVLVIPFGRFNLKCIIHEGLKENFIRYMDQVFARAESLCQLKKQRNGMPCTQLIVIYDADELSVLSLASFGVVDMVLEIVRRFEANHPESLKSAYIVNASRVFSFLFGLIKPKLSQKSFGKVVVLESKAALHDVIPLSSLPLYLGGAKDTLLDKFVRFNRGPIK